MEIYPSFSLEEIFFVIANAFSIAGLLIVSINGLKAGEDTIINQAYNTKATYEYEEVDGKRIAKSIPKDDIRNTIKEKCNYGFGFAFTAAGLLISAIVDTKRPEKYCSEAIIIMLIISFIVGSLVVRALTSFKLNKIIKKLENGELTVNKGIKYRIIATSQFPRPIIEENEN